jgi:hypothetical protein
MCALLNRIRFESASLEEAFAGATFQPQEEVKALQWMKEELESMFGCGHGRRIWKLFECFDVFERSKVRVVAVLKWMLEGVARAELLRTMIVFKGAVCENEELWEMEQAGGEWERVSEFVRVLDECFGAIAGGVGVVDEFYREKVRLS